MPQCPHCSIMMGFETRDAKNQNPILHKSEGEWVHALPSLECHVGMPYKKASNWMEAKKWKGHLIVVRLLTPLLLSYLWSQSWKLHLRPPNPNTFFRASWSPKMYSFCLDTEKCQCNLLDFDIIEIGLIRFFLLGNLQLFHYQRKRRSYRGWIVECRQPF